MNSIFGNLSTQKHGFGLYKSTSPPHDSSSKDDTPLISYNTKFDSTQQICHGKASSSLYVKIIIPVSIVS